MYVARTTTFFFIRGAVQNSLESVHLLRLDHESFSLIKTHIAHSISAYVSFIYRMAVESSGFLASNSQHRDCPGYHVERMHYPSQHALSAYVLMDTYVLTNDLHHGPSISVY